MSIVSGARLTKRGFHLGHFLGCFSSLINNKTYQEYEYFFVIDNKNIYNFKSDQEYNNALIKAASELYAIKKYYSLKKFHVVTQSDLLRKSEHFINYMYSNIGINDVIKAFPKSYGHIDGNKVMISKKDESRNIILNDFLYSINDAICSIVLKADFNFYNDDNLRSVRFAQKLIKKTNKDLGKDCFNVPTLICGEDRRLYGYNYKKMCNKNRNAIYLEERRNEIYKKIHQLFDLNCFFKAYPEEIVKCKNMENSFMYRFPQNFLPFKYLNIFGEYERGIPESFYFPCNKNKVKDELFRIICNILEPIEKLSIEFRKNKLLIFDYLKSDLDYAKVSIEDSVEKFLKARKISDLYFF